MLGAVLRLLLAQPMRAPFLVDGTNLIRSLGGKRRGFPALLSVVDALRREAPVVCIFDAQTHGVLDSQGYAVLYEALLLDASDHFIQAPPGLSAGDLLLLAADRHRGTVVSNDRFRDYRSRFSWLEGTGRLVACERRGARLRVGRRCVTVTSSVVALAERIIRNREVRC